MSDAAASDLSDEERTWLESQTSSLLDFTKRNLCWQGATGPWPSFNMR